jgi:hypothetical protein
MSAVYNKEKHRDAAITAMAVTAAMVMDESVVRKLVSTGTL